MKIYTKTGDEGTTSLINGTRVPKFHVRIEAYGTVDELMSYIGLLRDLPEMDKKSIETLIKIQTHLMTIASILATEQNNNPKLPQISPSDVNFIEQEIDQIEIELSKPQAFVLPGGNYAVSHAHIARCICRRAERLILKIYNEFGGNKIINQYINRLSDYLFVLARKLSKDLGVNEIFWYPNL